MSLRLLSNISGRRLISANWSSSSQCRDYGSGGGDPNRKEISFQQYTDDFVKRGRQSPTSWTEYKNNEYLNWNKWSYYDVETELTKYRLPQPNPKVPEKPRDTIPPAPTPEKK